MKPKIFNIGLSRTGTFSIDLFFKSFGLKSRHTVLPLLQRKDWTSIDEYDALGDTPIPMYYKECDQRYPDSKFILTTRDKESWLESMQWMFTHGRILWFWSELINNYNKKFYGTKKYNRNKLSKTYDDYHKEVSEYFKDRKEDLFVITIGKEIDYKSLCAFIDVPYDPAIKIESSNHRRYATPKQFMKYHYYYWFVRPFKKEIHQ